MWNERLGIGFSPMLTHQWKALFIYWIILFPNLGGPKRWIQWRIGGMHKCSFYSAFYSWGKKKIETPLGVWLTFYVQVPYGNFLYDQKKNIDTPSFLRVELRVGTAVKWFEDLRGRTVYIFLYDSQTTRSEEGVCDCISLCLSGNRNYTVISHLNRKHYI